MRTDKYTSRRLPKGNLSLTGFTSIKLPFSFKDVILATGPELKGSFSILKGDTVFTSKLFSDLKDISVFEDFKKTISNKEKELRCSPKIIASDLHPEYVSTKYAREIFEKNKKRTRILEIQHHHAHVASCMAEYNLEGKVIGVAFDGTGYGSDGNIWGGEFLIADYCNFKRIAHLEYIPMPGADKAVLEPLRMAFSYLYKTYKGNLAKLDSSFLKRVGKDKYSVFAKMIEKNINSPLTSSAGRLFDAVSSLIGMRDSISYEGEAAIELEKMAASDCKDIYKFEIKDSGGEIKVLFYPMIKAIVSGLKRREPNSLISRKFHNTLAEAVKEVSSLIREETKLNRVVLTGGVFQNKILLHEAKKRLEDAQFLVYTHLETSCSDRSLSLGQAVIAAHKTRKRRCV